MSNFFNNGQRMPNIFERARAYEDGNEGYVQQQKPKTKELFDFFDNYGHNGIKINVNSE